MQHTLRPYVTTGVAVVGAVVIAVVPVAPQLLDAPHRSPDVRQYAVRLTADPTDPFGPYAELFANTAANLQALGSHAFEFPVLSQLVSDPAGSITHLPDVIALLTNLLPSVALHGLPLPIQISAELPVWLSQTLATVGPLITVGNAFGDIGQQIIDGNALAAILGAPATLLNALLNGTDSLEVMGIGLPLFNGLLVAGQPFDVTMDVGQLVDTFGMGDQTIADLLGDLGDQTISSLAVELLDSVGWAQLTPVDLLDEFGLGQQQVSALIVDLLDANGLGGQTIAELADQLGFGGDTTLASIINGLLDATGVGNPSLTDLVAQFGLGDASLGSLIKDVLAATGMGGVALTALVDPELSLGDLLNGFVGDATFTGLLTQLGVGDMTLPDLLAMALGDLGNQSLLDLLGLGFLGPLSPEDMLIDVFQAMLPPGLTIGVLLNNPDSPMGEMTLGELISAGNGPDGTGMGDMLFTDLLTMAGVGDQTLMDLNTDPANVSNINKIGNPTLNGLMGANTVEQTMQNLKLWDLTLNQIMAALGPVRLKQVEEAQGRIVAVIRRLEEAEEIFVMRGGEEDMLV